MHPVTSVMFYLGVVATGLYFPAGEDWGETFDESFPACLLLFFFVCLFVLCFKVDITSRTPIPLFR